MTRETKFGLMLVLMLTTAFGFLVYKRLHQPKNLVATTATEDGDTTAGETVPTNSEPEQPGLPLASVPNPETPQRPTSSKPAVEEDPFGETVPTISATPTKPTTSKPKLPTDLDQGDFFDPPAKPVTATPVSSTETSTESDPFSNATQTTVGQTEPPTNTLPVRTQENDPFGTAPVTETAPPTRSVPVAASPTGTETDPFDAGPQPTAPTRSPQSPAVTTAAPVENDPFFTKDPEPTTTDGPTTRTPVIEPGPTFTESVPTVESPRRPSPTTAIPVEADPFGETPVEVSARSTPAVTTPVNQPESEPATPVASDPFAADTQPRLAVPNNPSPKAAVAESDPFGVTTLPARPAPTTPTAAAPKLAAPEQDPLLDVGPAATPRVLAVPERTPGVPAGNDPRLGGFVPVQRVETESTSTTVIPTDDEFNRTPTNPQRQLNADVQYFQPGQETRGQPRSAPRSPVVFAGEEYIVQPNENFWEISKKVYGTGRYFEALARYNAAIVPDPQRMKPGIKLATPSPEVLQSKFPQLLAAAGTQVSPVVEPAALGLPGETYVVREGDNYWEMSKRLYGDGKYFRALELHNAAIVPDAKKLRPGMKVAAPPAEWLGRKYPQSIASAAPDVEVLKRTQPDRYQPEGDPGLFFAANGSPLYRVGANDTLGEIARTHLGRSSRWVQILELNREILKDGNALSIGTVLRMPADASQVQVIGSERNIR